MMATATNETKTLSNREIVNQARLTREGLFNRERLLAGIRESEFDAIIAATPENVTYTGGAHIQLPLMFTFVVTRSDGAQAVVVNEADAYYMRENSWIDDIRSYRFAANATVANHEALNLLRDILTEWGVTSGKLGLETTYIAWSYFERLKESCPAASWEDANHVFNHAREIKTPAEIDLFRVAAYSTDKAIHTAFAMCSPGDTEKALAAEMQANVLRLGAESLTHGHVHAGVHSTVVHALSIERPCARGEVIHVDFGGSFAGYCTDISRNAVVEEASTAQRDIYRKLWEIEQELFEYVRPGVVANDVFETNEAAFERVNLVYPWGTIGHSTGLAVHEGFELARGSERVLEAGMILQIEPSHIEAGDARYHIEDSVVVTDAGVDLLSDFTDTSELFVIQ
jgi:Xaa-Pro aminopeptidase/Xaa-Pro dipeptidase